MKNLYLHDYIRKGDRVRIVKANIAGVSYSGREGTVYDIDPIYDYPYYVAVDHCALLWCRVEPADVVLLPKELFEI
jgi:hypothetical protein